MAVRLGMSPTNPVRVLAKVPIPCVGIGKYVGFDPNDVLAALTRSRAHLPCAG